MNTIIRQWASKGLIAGSFLLTVCLLTGSLQAQFCVVYDADAPGFGIAAAGSLFGSNFRALDGAARRFSDKARQSLQFFGGFNQAPRVVALR